MNRLLVPALAVALFLPSFALAREWSVASGDYRIEGEMLARNETTVVLEKKNKDLLAVPIAELSEEDRSYLESHAQAAGGRNESAMQTWTTRRGLKVRGAVVEYGRRDVVIRRRYGKVYVNDIRFDNLPAVYQKMVPAIVSHFERVELEDEKAFSEWAASLGGESKTYTCDGVLLELENGDLYAVPFFFFSDDDRKILEPGWESWAKAEQDHAYREQRSLALQAEAIANRRYREEMRRVAMLQLQLQGYDAGLFDLWEVALYPANAPGQALSVVVPARNSQQAAQEALAKHPGYRVGPIAKVSRKR